MNFSNCPKEKKEVDLKLLWSMEIAASFVFVLRKLLRRRKFEEIAYLAKELEAVAGFGYEGRLYHYHHRYYYYYYYYYYY